MYIIVPKLHVLYIHCEVVKKCCTYRSINISEHSWNFQVLIMKISLKFI